MRSIVRGFRSFRRHPGRNLVIVLLLFICLTFSMSMLAVELAADSQVESIKEGVGTYGEAKVSSDYKMDSYDAEREKSRTERQQEARSMTDDEEFAERTEYLVPEELTDTFSQDNHIDFYDKVLTTEITMLDLENTEMEALLSMSEGMSEGMSESGSGGEGMGAPVGVGDLTEETFVFEGNTDGASSSDFITGQKKLIEGSYFTFKDHQEANPVVLIEENVVDENDLSLGDTVVAEIEGENGGDAEVELEIVGIYETLVAETGEDGSSFANINPAGNKFFAPLSVVQGLNATPGYVTLGSYYFDNADNAEVLTATFEMESGNDSKYEFATDHADYAAIADPLLKVKNTSVIGLAGALGACALIILLAMVITISGRTRELGVLKAIGATDRQVMFQYAMEVACICLVAIVLAMGVTALISQPMGDWLLSDKTTTETAQVEEENSGMPQVMMKSNDSLYKEGGAGATGIEEETTTSLDVVYKGRLLGYAVAILLGISLLGMAVPIIWITRLRPARVLSME